MSILRPATPGFLVTLVATALLAVVSFCVPYFKSVYFLRASISVNSVNGSITFGTLGYCLELANGTSCSKPSVGYELDINGLVGNRFPIDIPNVVVKWLTYALVLHIVALALAAGSAFFGLLAHVREMSMTCCSTCVSGFAAAVAMIAFIFDLALFFIAKARINKVPGGSAQIGNAIWLTLAAWILLFFSGCFYTVGRCCISKRKPRDKWGRREGDSSGANDAYTEQMRLDAVKAEADRKARQKASEGGLPAFFETQPLTARVDGDAVYVDTPYKDHHDISAPQTPYGRRPSQGNGYAGGYAQAPPGTRAVDEYYNPSENNNATTYPPQPQQPQPQQPPRRQASGYAASTYAPSTYTYTAPTTSPPPTNNQYLAAGNQPYTPDRYGTPGHEYGHAQGGTSYHSAASHQQHPSAYSQHPRDPSFSAETYNATSAITSPPATSYTSTTNPYTSTTTYPSTTYSSTPYYSSPSNSQEPPLPHERQYTLGGDGYGANSVPPLNDQYGTGYFPYLGETKTSPSPINTTIAASATPALPGSGSTSPVKGPRPQPGSYDDAPPTYEAGTSGITGAWGKHS